MQVTYLVRRWWKFVRPGQIIAIDPDSLKARIDRTDYIVVRMITDVQDLVGRHIEAARQVLKNLRIGLRQHDIRCAY